MQTRESIKLIGRKNQQAARVRRLGQRQPTVAFPHLRRFYYFHFSLAGAFRTS